LDLIGRFATVHFPDRQTVRPTDRWDSRHSPVAEGLNLAMSGNNRFSAFFSSPYHVVQ